MKILSRIALLLAVIGGLAACGAPGPLPPEQRRGPSSAPPAERAPERYEVRRGDTLYSIAFRFGMDWREVARWNDIPPPYTIRVGQPIRLQPDPVMQPTVARRDRPVEARPDPDAEGRPAPGTSRPAPPRATPQARELPRVDPPSGSAAEPESRPAPEPEPEPERVREPAPEPVAQPRATPPGDPGPPATPPPSAATRSVAGVAWRWPTEGRLAGRFNAGDTRKGILIAGEEGQAVRAAGAGSVVYSGSGLIGYGELIIIKHSDRMLSAYAHNRERLVSEGDSVVAGAEIARLGRNERNDAVLHFEIRRDGQPDDPLKYLPER